MCNKNYGGLGINDFLLWKQSLNSNLDDFKVTISGRQLTLSECLRSLPLIPGVMSLSPTKGMTMIPHMTPVLVDSRKWTQEWFVVLRTLFIILSKTQCNTKLKNVK